MRRRFGDAFVELFEGLAGEEGAGGVVGIGEIDELGFGIDGIGEGGEIVMPIAVGDGAIGDAAAAREEFRKPRNAPSVVRTSSSSLRKVRTMLEMMPSLPEPAMTLRTSTL